MFSLDRPARWTALLACGVLAMGCTSSPNVPTGTDSPAETSTSSAYSTSTPSVSATALSLRGSIVSSSADSRFDVGSLPTGTRSTSVVYRSVSGVTGEQTQVTGAVFVPAGPPPLGGFPVVAYAHGTVGIAPGCAPTENPTLSGDLDVVSHFLELGYAVAYTDYQGLSDTVASPAHPYLEPRTAGVNVIDSVRAARALDPTLSTRWVAVGHSQGGHAAWAADQYDALYGDGLDLVGAAVLAPALDVSPVVADAQSASLSSGQRSLYSLIVEGAAAVDPSIRPSSYLHGALGAYSSALGTCGPSADAARAAANAEVELGDTTASSVDAVSALTTRLQQYSLPKSTSSAPILAVYGSADDIVRRAWTDTALGRACGFGDTVLKVRLEGEGHSIDAGPLLDGWIADRFTGLPAPDNC